MTVTVAPGLPPERLAVFEREDGSARLRNAVLGRLLGRRKGETVQADELRVTVTRFRLRSTGITFWVGAMAGADMFDVTVTVVRGGVTTRTFDTGVGGAAAFRPSASGRFNNLVAEVAERIVAGL